MKNLELIKQVYKNFAEGNVEEVLAVFDSGIEWHECKSLPFAQGGDGIFHGPQSILENVFSKIPDRIDGFNIEISELIGSNGKVTMVGYYKGIWKATGKSFKANATHVWTVNNGKAVKFFQAVDTAEMMYK